MGRPFKIAVVLAVLWLLVIGSMIVVGPKEDAGATADVAIVLGAAIEGDQPSPVFRERILHGIALWRSGRVRRILFTGGFGPELNIAESEVARRLALAEGVPANAILSEAKSRTTRQNLVEAQGVMKTAGLSSALIVSDPLHLYRSMAMAKGLNLPARPSATPTTQYRSLSTKLPFLLRELYFVHHYWVLGE